VARHRATPSCATGSLAQAQNTPAHELHTPGTGKRRRRAHHGASDVPDTHNPSKPYLGHGVAPLTTYQRALSTHCTPPPRSRKPPPLDPARGHVSREQPNPPHREGVPPRCGRVRQQNQGERLEHPAPPGSEAAARSSAPPRAARPWPRTRARSRPAPAARVRRVGLAGARCH